MDRFHLIDDAAVILRTKGVYRQVKVYRRGTGIYAGQGTGFIRLYKGGGTGVPSTSWDDIDMAGAASPDGLFADVHGKLLLPDSVKQIEAQS